MYDFNSYHDRRRNRSSKWLKMDALNDNPKADVIPMTTADMDFSACPKFKVKKQEASFLGWIDYSEFNVDDKVFNDFLVEDCDFYINSGDM